MIEVILIDLSPSSVSTFSGDLMSIISLPVRLVVRILHVLTIADRMVNSIPVASFDDLAYQRILLGIRSKDMALLIVIRPIASRKLLIEKFDSSPAPRWIFLALVPSVSTPSYLSCRIWLISAVLVMILSSSLGSISLLTMG